MTKPLLIILLILLLTSQHFYGQGIDHSLYTSINIFLTKPNPYDNIPDNEFYKIDSNALLKQIRLEDLTAFIADSTTQSKYYNANLLIGYFVNNSYDTLLIDRCDDAILKSETQIFIKNKWVTFQLNLPSDCGLSYFTTKLPPKSYYVLQIPDPTTSDGGIETKFRVKFTFDNKMFYTNSVIVKLSQERISKTKHKINPRLWD